MFIAAFLLLQLAIPLRFYLGSTGPDERFAWRMFSTLQRELELARPQVVVTDVTTTASGVRQQAVALESQLSPPWIRFLQYGYPPVVDKFMRWWPEQSDAQQVRYLRRGSWQDGTPLETLERTAQAGDPES